MEIYIWIVLGLTAGWLISLFMGTYSVQSMLTDVVLGTIGAIVGGLLLNILAQPGASGINLYSIFVAGLGATVLIWLGKMISTPTE